MTNFKLENYLLSALKATESAAIAAYELMGKGDEKAADGLAVTSMRQGLNAMAINGTVVIGEGERDEAPMLYIGEKVGDGSSIGFVPELDVALDPLEGTTILSTGGAGSLTVLALTYKGGFLHAPDVYMDKIAIGFNFKEQLIDLNNSVKENLSNVAKAKKCSIGDLVVSILKRPRHQELIAKVRETGARVKLFGDGDIASVIETTMPHGSNVYMGIGGAPEGVLAAAALKTIGGQMCGRLLWDNDEQKNRASTMGIKDLNQQYHLNDLASKDVIFLATGVTNGSLLKGVSFSNDQVTTHSLIMDSNTSMVRKIKTKSKFVN